MATQTYKVASGDTLSAIAKKHGVKVADISGYKSGNPDLIYPNEVLTINTPTTPTIGVQSIPSTTAASTTAVVKPPTTTVSSPTLPLKNAPPTLPLVTTSPVVQATTPQTVTTQPPIVTPVSNPKIGNSQIDAGKQAITDLTTMGLSSDINTIRSNWSKFGLDTKLGSWIGSATQWNAYAKYAKDDLDRISAGIKDVQEKTTALAAQVAKENETVTPPPTTTSATLVGGGTTGTTPTNLTLDQLNNVQLSSTDIGDIITEMEGEAATPETVIAGEAAQLLTDEEKSRAAQALATFQQQMAKSGMAFSSIRSSGEEGAAAESLSKLSGIRLDLADKIVKAARAEQTRRINAIQLQNDAQTAALKSMGYVINPVNGQLTKTLERQKFEEPAQPVRFSSGRNVYEYDPSTGGITTLVEGVDTPPTSYQEYVLAGEQAGTGKSYAEFLSDRGETQSEKTTALKIAAFAKARPFLEADKGADGYVNPDNYMRLRNDFAQTIGDVTEFDELFAPMLSPQNRLRLGVGKVSI